MKFNLPGSKTTLDTIVRTDEITDALTDLGLQAVGI